MMSLNKMIWLRSVSSWACEKPMPLAGAADAATLPLPCEAEV